MTTIVTRAGKGSALTHNEVDSNFINLNNAKYESGNNATFGTIGGTTITASTGFSGALNGTVGASTPAAGTFTSLSDSGNLNFTGTSNRITGDFSNATPANRVAFQTSTTNSNTALLTIPNGTATFSGWQFVNNSDPTNGSFLQVGASSSAVGIVSSIFGTGSFLPMTFTNGGSERMRIDTSGNVGIGTSSPTGKLDVNGKLVLSGGEDNQLQWTNNSQTWRINNSTGGQLYIYDVTGTKFPFKISAGASSDSFVINSSGNVGIGTSSPVSRLASPAVGGSVPTITIPDATNNRYSVGIGSINVGGVGQRMDFYAGDSGTNGTNLGSGALRMSIDANGNVLVGTTSVINGGHVIYKNNSNGLALTAYNAGTTNGYAFDAVSSSGANTGYGLIRGIHSGGTLAFIVYGNGNVANTNNSYGSLSDERLKENITDTTPKLNDLCNVKIRNFNLIADESKTKQIGVVAQELEKIFPSMIDIDGDGFKSVKYSVFVPMLVKAIQELKAELDVVKAEINTLKGN